MRHRRRYNTDHHVHPADRTPSKSELRARRTERRGLLEQPDISRAVLGIKRGVKTIHDAKGRLIYDYALGVSALNTNIIGRLAMTLLPAHPVRELERIYSRAELFQQLEEARSALPPEFSCELGKAAMFGTEGGQYKHPDQRYAGLIVTRASQRAINEEKEEIFSTLGMQSNPSSKGHITLYVASNALKAELICQEATERLAFPATVAFDEPTIHPFRRFERRGAN